MRGGSLHIEMGALRITFPRLNLDLYVLHYSSTSTVAFSYS